MPEYFAPNIGNSLEKPLRLISFQQSQQAYLFKQAQSSVRISIIWFNLIQRTLKSKQILSTES